MIHATESKPQRLQSENLLLEELPDELMIYDPPRNKAFCLNQTAAFVWRHADGNTTVSQIADLMERELGKPANEQMVWFALEILSKDGLLAPSTIVPEEAVVDLSRRKLLQKLGAGAIALPVVTVLLVSPAKAHASSKDPSGPPTVPPSGAGTIPSQSSGGFWKWLEDLF